MCVNLSHTAEIDGNNHLRSARGVYRISMIISLGDKASLATLGRFKARQLCFSGGIIIVV